MYPYTNFTVLRWFSVKGDVQVTEAQFLCTSIDELELLRWRATGDMLSLAMEVEIEVHGVW